MEFRSNVQMNENGTYPSVYDRMVHKTSYEERMKREVPSRGTREQKYPSNAKQSPNHLTPRRALANESRTT